MKMFCNVFDNGSTYLVENAFIMSTSHINFTTGNKIIEIDDVAVYESIVYNLTKKNTVRIPKNVHPLTPSDIIVKALDDKLGVEKIASISEIKNLVNNRVGNIANYNFFEHNVLNNVLASKGYTITGDTKEDQYLAILSSGDSALIDILQKFLEVQAKIEEHISIYSDCNKALHDIEDAIDSSSVEQIKNTFLSTYY